MKRILLISVILAAMLLSACAAPVATPEPTPTPTPTPAPAETILTPTPTPTYTLSVSVSPSGAGSVAPPGGKYESGLQVTLTATPASGYTFDYWDGAASGSSHTVIITMNSNKSITAHFKAVETPPAPPPTPTPTPTPEPTPTPTIITSEAELESFLNANFGTCQTSLGPTSFTYLILENTSITSPHDYSINTYYDFVWFMDLKNSNTITTEMNHTVSKELKAFQEELARTVIEKMPGKKLKGRYVYLWYTYPNIKVDLNSRQYYNWCNYQPDSILTKYEDAKVTDFTWLPECDDNLER